jgi:nucleoid-associated protein YgaU
MALQDKYKQLIDTAQAGSVTNLSVQEQNNVLYISGTASQQVKDQLWSVYNTIDPDMRSADVVLNIEADGSGGEQSYTVSAGENLTRIAKKFPGLTWKDIFEANQDQLTDPDKIRTGQVLKIPQK